MKSWMPFFHGVLAFSELPSFHSLYFFLSLLLLRFHLKAITAQEFFFAYAGEHLTKRLRKKAFQGILRQNIGWFDEEKHNTGILTSRLASDATLVQVTA